MPEWVRLSEGLCVRLILLARDSRPADGRWLCSRTALLPLWL